MSALPMCRCEEGRKVIRNPEKPAYHGIEWNGDAWYIMGCCGHCYVLGPISYCPFCGELIREPNDRVARGLL